MNLIRYENNHVNEITMALFCGFILNMRITTHVIIFKISNEIFIVVYLYNKWNDSKHYVCLHVV